VQAIDNQMTSNYSGSILKVLHYINQNLTGNLSLEALAQIANYSPFHFQKIFTSTVNESPKQYVIRLRLERAAHYLKVFPNLPVVEIGHGCGFSSPSVFSRAFKSYYGVSAENFRDMPFTEISTLSKQTKDGKKFFALDESEHLTYVVNNLMSGESKIQISPAPVIKTIKHHRIACVQTVLSHPESISFAFKSLMQWAIPNDLVISNVKYFGVWLDAPFLTSLNKCRYLAGIEIADNIKPRKGIEIVDMAEGKYAIFSMAGNLETTLSHIVAANHNYVIEMGYDITEIICYEIFDECPTDKPYDQINKTILLPVKAKT